MSDLYTVNKSPMDRNSLDSCLKFATSGASILLIEDGVYGALKGTTAEAKVSSAMGDKKVYALGPDLKARGLNVERVIDGIEIVDYAGFVDLVEANDKVQAWL
jgi:tRNA 2-thiouridine synthesizing protein B